jgi:hypothetical protein
MSLIARILRPALHHVMRNVMWLWALPLTLCGFPLWLLLRAQQRSEGRKYASNQAVAHIKLAQEATVFIAYGEAAKWLLQHHPFGEMDAMAIGCCVFAQDQASLDRTLAHELVHVEQALRWGPVFPLAYGLCSVWQKCHGQCPYTNNYFELEASKACK